MERPTRIAWISEHASPVALLGGVDAGGQNVYVDEVSRNLALRGYAVDVFTRRDSEEVAECITWSQGVRVIHLSAGPAQRRPKDELWPFMPEFRDSFLRFMQREELSYDILHGNFWMSGWVASELKQALNIPAVQIFHAMGKTKRRHQRHVDTSPGDRIRVELDIVQRVDRLIAQCPSERSELVNDYHAPAKKVVTIPSAVNIKTFRPVDQADARQRIGLAPDDFVIVYVGRLLPRKDIRNVVRATALLVRKHEQAKPGVRPNITLMIVGGETVDPNPAHTPELSELQHLAAELGIRQYVRFIGKRQQDTLRDYYRAGDVVVTTPWYEPFGLTPLEGMACGRPVIGSAVGGITYTVADGETGFLVRPRDPAQLAIRLDTLKEQPELRLRMGQAARLRVEQEFTWPVVALRTASLYETLLTSRSAPTTFSFPTTPSPVITASDRYFPGGGK